MNLNDLHKELIAAARSQLPGDRVPHTFEKRVMALLREPLAPDYREWWARGLWRAALACLAFMLLLGDQPFIGPAIINRVLDEYQKNKPAIVIPVYNGKRGHPVIFDAKYKDELLAIADRGARAVLDNHLRV